jgi:PAS domain S-box-containing protein
LNSLLKRPGRDFFNSLLLPLGLIGLLLLFCGSFYFREARQIENSSLSLQSARVDMFARLFQQNMNVIAGKLRFLASGDALSAYLAMGETAYLDRAIEHAVYLSRQEAGFDEIQYLDERGREVISVDQAGRVVPPGELQDKSDQPYFQKASALAPGRIYVSAFELNVENNRVEQPPRPMLRFAVPVFDAVGRRRGIYTIKYLGNRLFSQLQEFRPDLQSQLRLLNARGFWLKTLRPEQEWGFMYPDRNGANLAHIEPGLWSKMAGQPKGQARTEGGFESWRQIDPRQGIADSPDSVVAEDSFLVLAMELSGQEYGKLFAGLRRVFVILTAFLLISALMTERLFRSWRQGYQALHRAEANLAVTMRSVGDAVLVTNAEGRITRLNPVAEDRLGWTQTEALGRPVGDVFQIINDQTREPGVTPLEAVRTTGETQKLTSHTSLIARDGAERPIAESAATIRGADGETLGGVLVFRDVTEDSAAQKALRHRETRYRALFDSINEGFCIIQVIFDDEERPVDYRFLEINPSFEKHTGIRDALGKRMRELSPDHEEHWFEIYGRVAATGEAIRFQNRAEQLHRAYDVYAYRFGEPQDRQVAILLSDITEQHRAQEVLRHSEENLNVTLDAIRDAVLATDAEGTIIRMNPVAEQITGWNQANARGRPIGEVFRVINETTRQPAIISLDRVLTAEEIQFPVNHSVIVTRDGTERPIAGRAKPVRDIDGGVLGIIHVFHDVTAERHAWLEFQRLKEGLEKHTAERAVLREQARPT